jgi:hypothetical protein
MRKLFMLGKNGIKVFDHNFPHKLTLKFLGDHSLSPCISHVHRKILCRGEGRCNTSWNEWNNSLLEKIGK